MPIASGAIGKPCVLGIPGQARTGSSAPRSTIGSEGSVSVGARTFRSQNFSSVNPRIQGITKDSTGAVLGNCIVQLFRTADDLLMSETTSDASGIYIVDAVGPGPFYIVAYKAGAPDVAGTTVNTLLAG